MFKCINKVVNKNTMATVLAVIMVLSSFLSTGLIQVKAGIPVIPEVLITELMSNPTGEFNGDDLFEYVELYNAGKTSINLKDYKLIYSTYGGSTKKVNDITANIVIAPGEVAVVWIYNTNSKESYGEYGSWTYDITTKFREHYNMGGNTPICLVNGITASGGFNLANSGIKDVMIAYDSSKVENTATFSNYISHVIYNSPSNKPSDADSTTDSVSGKSVIYKYPEDNSKLMQKLATAQTPTPGIITYEQKPINYDDPAAPNITHVQPVSSMLPGKLAVTTTVTDETDLRYARIYYETNKTSGVKYADMTASQSSADVFEFTIPEDLVFGSSYIKYYIEASDGLHTVTMPEDKTNPYTINIIDNDGPVIDVLNPVDKNFFMDYAGPVVIQAGYTDVMGIDTNSVKLYLNNNDITAEAAITDKNITYIPTTNLAYGKYSVKLEVSDTSTAKNKSEKIWTFTVGTAAGSSAGPDIPEILITELIANPAGDIDENGNLETSGVYEFVELYNASNHDINLKDYRLKYVASDGIRVGDLTDDAVIYPGQAAVIWVYGPFTKEAFNNPDNCYELDQNEKTAYAAKFRNKYSMPKSIPVYFMHGDSDYFPEGTTTRTFNLVNSGEQTIMVAYDTAAEGDYISTAKYNDDPDSNDVVPQKSLMYTYPTDNTNQMVRLRAGMDPTPGSISYQQNPINYTDTIEPFVQHEQTVSAMMPGQLKITAAVSDETQLRNVNLYYETFNTYGLERVDMTETVPGTDIYEAIIPESAITGSTYIKYYIEATDGLHTVTLPRDTNNAFTVSVTDNKGPAIGKLQPTDKFYISDNYRPTIYAEYIDASGINKESVRLYLDNQEVTAKAVITYNNLTYTPDTDISEGDHSVRLVLSDNSAGKNQTEKTWTFRIGPQIYNLYRGQIHAHTMVSDGLGTPDEAYTYARDVAKKDFFGLTEHGNYFTDEIWKEQLALADGYNVIDNYVTIPGFEMTWTNVHGWWGHINSYNTGWVESKRHVTANNLPNYYQKISETPESISQFNHPGYLWGDFGEYGYYSEEVDAVMDLMEVRTLAHEEDYARALDKGWHISPTNNEDNHKGAWAGTPNATVVLAPRLTRENILEAFRQNRTYAAQDEDIEVMYKVNGQVMGSRLTNPEKLNVSIEINHPSVNIGTVSIIADGHSIIASKVFDTTNGVWELELPAVYKYYYVRIEQPNKCLTVTAPVWVENEKPIVVSEMYVRLNEGNVQNPVQVRLNIENSGAVPLTDAKIEYYLENTIDSNKLGETELGTIESGEKINTYFDASVTSDKRMVYAVVSGKADGRDVATVDAISVPELLITEIVANSSKEDGIKGDAYEFIEVYNNTNEAIDIANYRIEWYSKAGATVANWDITASKLIQPEDTMVIWVKPNEETVISKTYEAFNAKYGINLNENQIVEVVGYGLDDVDSKTLFISKDLTATTSIKLSQARYNVETNINQDTQEDKSIQYRYPTDGTDILKRIDAGQTPTPGSVSPEQVPYVNRLSDATLSSIELNNGIELNPVFSSGIKDYSLSVANNVYGIAITPTVTSSVYKSLTVNNAATVSGAAYWVDLSVGQNKIEIMVTAGNEIDTETYTIWATREDPAVLSNDATLSGIALSDGKLAPSFSKAATSYKVSVGNSVSSITITPTVSSSVYKSMTVNGTAMSSGGSYTVSLKVGSTIIPIVVTAQDGTTRTYTIDITRARSQGGIPPVIAPPIVPGETKEPTITNGVVKVEKLELDSKTGAAKTVIEEKTLIKALEQANANGDGIKTVIVEISKVEGAISYTTALPASFLTAATGKVELKTELGTVTLPSKMLANANVGTAKEVSLIIGIADRDKLTDELKAKIGNRTVIELMITADGKVLEYNNPDAPVTVKVPYKPTAEELKNPEHIVVWYIDGKGNAIPVPNGRYDAATGTVIFKTTHFSRYAITSVFKTFDDIAGFEWAKDSIEVMAAKGIINGVSENAFDPDSDITRADFTMLLVKALGLTAKADFGFSDVSKDAYYYEALGISKKLGIVKGLDNNTFNPEAKISRQEMLVITARALKAAGKLDAAGTSADLAAFTDKENIADYAVNDIAAMVKTGLVKGSDNKVNPNENSIRAEAAVLIYRIYNK